MHLVKPDSGKQNSGKNGGVKPAALSCAEFQAQLPEYFSVIAEERFAGDPALNQHLETCENCSTLVRDLEYIAESARQLLEPVIHEPSPELWSSIESRLKANLPDDKSN